MPVALTLALGAALGGVGLERAEAAELPGDVERLLEAEPLPPAAVGPRRRYLLLVHERGLLSLEQLAEPAIEIAGRLVDPRTGARHAPIDYYGLTLVDLRTNSERRIALPRDATVGYPDWAPDGSKFAFTLRRSDGVELWVGDPRMARAQPVLDSLNASRGPPCAWMSDSRRLVCKRLTASSFAGRGSEAAGVELGRYAQRSAYGQPVMLSGEVARGLLESQLTRVDSATGHVQKIGAPAAFESVRPSPDGSALLVKRIHEPYPRVSGVDRVAYVSEIRNRRGEVLARLSEARRALGWNPAEPATLSWVERHAGRDRLIELGPPYTQAPEAVFELRGSFSGIDWVEEVNRALVHEYEAAKQRISIWRVDFREPRAAAERLMSFPSRSPRMPVMRSSARGGDVVLVHDGGFYVRGETARESDARAFLDHVSLADGSTRRVWQAGRTGYETLVDVLDVDAKRLLTRYESPSEPPNYFVTSAAGRRVRALTHHEHPAPVLTQANRIRLTYERDDGVALAGSLYLPPGYEGTERLPLVIWAYPRRRSAGAGIEPSAAVSDRFPGFESAFRRFFVLRGYAVLDDVSMPVVGSQAEANDTFVEQVTANARAAIEAADATGFVDASRVAVAGHSYGAFMVANLLAHSELFDAGAALSGAYNRTLTPFGFQTERRTFWEAPDTYLAMSPILYSHRIEAPLLLVHGLLDDNAGTSPLQSTQLYEAIRGNGGEAGLLLLPWEGHSYRARESVMQTAATMLDWFDRHLSQGGASPAERELGAAAPSAPAPRALLGMPER